MRSSTAAGPCVASIWRAASRVAAGDRRRDRRRQADADAGLDRREVTAATKSSRTDVVTAHDRAAEAEIVSGLLAERPDDAIVGEEGTVPSRNAAGSRGTSTRSTAPPTSSTAGPLWSTSIGAGRRRRPARRRGVRAHDRRAVRRRPRAQGATRNGRPIRCSDEDRPLARARRDRVRLRPGRPGAPGGPVRHGSPATCATSAAAGRPRSTWRTPPPASSTPTTSDT